MNNLLNKSTEIADPCTGPVLFWLYFHDSENNFLLQQDWSKAGQYEQTALTQQRRTEAAEPSSGLGGNGIIQPEDPYRLARMNSKDVAAKVLRIYFYIYIKLKSDYFIYRERKKFYLFPFVIAWEADVIRR